MYCIIQYFIYTTKLPKLKGVHEKKFTYCFLCLYEKILLHFYLNFFFSAAIFTLFNDTHTQTHTHTHAHTHKHTHSRTRTQTSLKHFSFFICFLVYRDNPRTVSSRKIRTCTRANTKIFRRCFNCC